jgi:uncharacterized protein (TIGR03067 family)
MQSSLLIGMAILIGAPAAKDPPKKEPTIVGEWIGEKAVRGGKEMPVPEGGIVITFTADGKLMIKEGNREKPEGATYTVDTKKNPAEIDLIPPAGRKDPTMPGIFKIEGDTLTICFLGAEVGGVPAGRPTKFESAEGSMSMLMILKRAKK